MSLADSSINGYLDDSVTIEPYTGQSQTQAPSYGAAVTYRANVDPAVNRSIDASGREFTSMCVVTISGQLQIDPRSRLTLPAGWVPNRPPIRKIVARSGVGLDHTEITL
jgi:hypothetical protein